MSKLKIEYIDIDKLIPYVNNPRVNDRAVDKVASSIKNFGFKNPIIIDKDNEIIAGHTRLKAARKLGLDEVPTIKVDDLTDPQIKAFRIADNKTSEFAEWDMDLLEIEMEDIEDLFTGFDDKEIEKLFDGDIEGYTLAEKWIIPPFSVIDGRLGEWLDRKRYWQSIGIQSELGRDDNITDAPDKPSYGKGTNTHMVAGTSIFDPALCELMYKWFNIDGGIILDPFAGGSVRGIVASKLGYKYIGNDLRGEQVSANIDNAREILVNGEIVPKWTIGDSRDINKLTDNVKADMIFTCPPYADLEVYSDLKDDISNMEYKDFLIAYREIIKNSTNQLQDNRFAIFVVGEVRDKKGAYYNLIGDTIQAFKDAGLDYYNEIVYITPNGTAGMRANRTFSGGRKVIKTHQNILVFYKGDIAKIKSNYTELDLEYIDKVLISE